MRLRIKVINEPDSLKEPFSIEFKKGCKILGFHSDDYQDKILVYLENERTEEKELRTFQFFSDGDILSDVQDLIYLGTRNSSSRYLFELLRLNKENMIPTM
ncbi:MAG: hypothetical protein R2685_02815 [Candidatus Nitrosocosmicus sp.]|jgi:hypothetical protein|nr:hypothetical protein [Candidatus Nitrosocosmicus sp.]